MMNKFIKLAYLTIAFSHFTISFSTAANPLNPPFVPPLSVTPNTPPQADAGTAQSQWLGSTFTLDGLASSDSDGDPLTYQWSLTSSPVGSNVALVNPLTATPQFTPDIPGSYHFSLIVNDGQTDSPAALVTIAAAATTVNIVNNGDFSAGLASWKATPGTIQTITTGQQGNELTLSQRASASDGTKQLLNVNSLTTAGKGLNYAASLKIALTQPAHVRVNVLIVDSLGSRQLQLAEKVVRTTGSFITVKGNAILQWQGSLNKCILNFEVAQITEGVYPDYTIDDVTFELDSDGDGLSDSEEITHNTNPFVIDTDHDGMPDEWEVAVQLNPLLDDANVLSDSDTFTNFQEYAGATDPLDGTQFPADPSDPALNSKGREILNYLAMLPANQSNRVIAGQHISESDPASTIGYDYHVTQLESSLNRTLAMVELQYDNPDLSTPFQINDTNLLAAQAWGAGKLVEIKWSPWNPWSQSYAHDSQGLSLVNVPAMLSGSDQQTLDIFTDYVDTIAAALADLDRQEIVVLFRPMSEMNGVWFWWGHLAQADYIALWQFVHHRLTVDKDLHNLIWVYESTSGSHDTTPSDYYYPGDAWVDVVGHNMYSDDWQASFDFNRIYRQYPKVYAIPQAGNERLSDYRDNQHSWDAAIIINNIEAHFPRVSYFSVWSTFGKDPGTQFVGIVDLDNQTGLLDHLWTVTMDDLGSLISGN